VPYLLVGRSVEPRGDVVRGARFVSGSFPAASRGSLGVEAMEKLEQARLAWLRQLWDRGAPIPVPRRRCGA